VHHLRRIAILLVLVMLFSLFTGCFGQRSTTTTEKVTTKTTAKGTTAKTTATTKKGETTKAGQTTATTQGTTAGKGSELSDFVNAYMDAKTAVWDKMNEALEAGSNPTAVMALLGFAFTDLQVVLLPMFDIVGDNGGILPLLGIKNAYRRQKGDVIEFGYDFTYEEDSGSKKKGDHVLSVGALDVKQNTLKNETIDRSGNTITNRNVIEITKNKDGSYTSQAISYQSDNEKVTGYFITFAGEDVWSVIAEKDAAEDFTFNTIYGKKNVAIDAMSQGFTVNTTASFVDGKAKVVSE
jgi:hypothetical protein